MSNLNGLGERIKEIEDLRAKFQKLEFPKINTEILNNISDIVKPVDLNTNIDFEMHDFKNPLVELAEDQNNSLKTLVKYNEDISKYNKELVSLNEKILNKINSLDDTLTFLNEAFSSKSKSDKKHSEQQLALLLELMTIIENKDSSKLQEFMNNIGAPVGVGLLIEVIKVKFGLG